METNYGVERFMKIGKKYMNNVREYIWWQVLKQVNLKATSEVRTHIANQVLNKITNVIYEPVLMQIWSPVYHIGG
jgi:hypothetical protein